MPAFPFLLCIATYSARLRPSLGLVTQFDLYHHATDMVNVIHQRIVGGPPLSVIDLHEMAAEQQQYEGLLNSNWYYNSIQLGT